MVFMELKISTRGREDHNDADVFNIVRNYKCFSHSAYWLPTRKTYTLFLVTVNSCTTTTVTADYHYLHHHCCIDTSADRNESYDRPKLWLHQCSRSCCNPGNTVTCMCGKRVLCSCVPHGAFLYGGRFRSLFAKHGKGKNKKSLAAPPPPPQRFSLGENVFDDNSITVSSTWELTPVGTRYS